MQDDLHFAFLSHKRLSGQKAALPEGKQLGGYKQNKEVAVLLATAERGETRTILHGDCIDCVMIADGAHKKKTESAARSIFHAQH